MKSVSEGSKSLGDCIRSKKAQLAAFIIIGILILAMGGAYIYISQLAKKTDSEKIIEKGIEVSLDETKIKEFITACIKKEGNELVDKIELQGGTLSLSRFRYYDNVKYNYFCINDEESGCVNRLITRKSMADELNNAMKGKIKECVSFDRFRKEGYDVKEEEISVKTTIAVDDVNFELSYPIMISKDGQTINLNRFTADVDSKLGKLYDLAANIAYQEILAGSFDEDRWMLGHGAEMKIEKHRPYPDVVYSLKTKGMAEEEAFNFAFNGRYTVYDAGKPSKKYANKGYCQTDDKNCYADVNQESCVKAGGKFSSSPFTGSQCAGLSVYSEKSCEGEECKGCGKRKHGESWCEYEGLTSPGFSLVGSRHYKGSCMDGKIYYTECRDYREEVCVDNDKLEIPKAVCRTNRWQDCAKQTIKEKCMDNSARDCYWSGYLTLDDQGTKISETSSTHTTSAGTVTEVSVGIGIKAGRCIPYIPPGFMHWQQNGNEVCAMANQQFDCPYYTCGQSWVDSSALYCTFMGDCGNYRNTEGELTLQGHFNFDSTPSDYVYLAEEQLKLKTKPRLKMDIETVPELDGTEFQNPHGSVSQIIDKQIKYMDEVAGWKYEDFRNNYIWYGNVNVHVLQTALCMPWQAPYKGKSCEKCSSPNRPCTEYKCRSLGQTCNYEEINGIGFCYDYAEKDKIPPRLFFDGTMYKGFSIKEDSFGKAKGYRINSPLQPFAPVIFGLNASEPVRCKVVALPEAKYEQIPIPSSPFFNDFYVFFDIVPKPVDFRIGLMKSLGVNNFLELGSYETYDAKFKNLVDDAKKAVEEFGGPADRKAAAMKNIQDIEGMWKNNFAPNIKKLFDKMGDTMRDIAIQAEQGNKLIFFKCVDKAGNENKEDIFLKYRIADDSSPPYVIWVSPSNETGLGQDFDSILYTTEPATCRYSDNDEDYEMMDQKDETECTGTTMLGFTRAYQCLPKSMDFGNKSKIDLFIRCKDKPAKIDRYGFNLTVGDEMAQDPESVFAIGLDKTGHKINLTPKWAQYYALPEIMNIMVDSDEAEIVINVNEKLICRYSLEQGISFGSMEPMDCKEGPKGIFPCTAKIEFKNGQPVEIACMKSFMEEERNANKESMVLTYLKAS